MSKKSQLTKQQLDGTKLHFIVGMGRSGTTLLMQMLNTAPCCLATPETRFIMTFYGKYAHQIDIDPETLIEDITDYYQIRQKDKPLLNTWQYDTATFRTYLYNSPKPLQYTQVCKAFLLCQHFLGNTNQQVAYIIDKDHDYTQWLPELLHIFPDAKFIVSLRDYRAVINSHRQSPNSRLNVAAFTALLWRNNNQYLRQKSQEMLDKFLWVKYEDIIADQTKTVQQICDFIGIPFQPSMLQSHLLMQAWLEQHAQHPDMSERKAKKWTDLARPINPTRRESWRKHLTPTTIALADLICGQEALHHGYQPITQLNALQKTSIILRHIPQLMYAIMAYTLFAKWYYRIPLALRMMAIKHLKIKK